MHAVSPKPKNEFIQKNATIKSLILEKMADIVPVDYCSEKCPCICDLETTL